MNSELYLDTGIKKIVIDEIQILAKKYNVEKVKLFGSRARGDHKTRSDIDLAVYGGDTVLFSLAVDEETSTLLSYDIVDMSASMQDDLRESIEEEGVIIYEKI